MRERLRVGFLTDPGREKELNEDSLYVDEEIGLFIVADGMGGHNAGEVASRIAVEVIAKAAREGVQAGREVAEVFREAIAKANKTIFERSLNNPAWSEMGTTLLMALATDHNIVIGHVGDSRAYLVQKGQMRQLTEDHTFVAEWLKEGKITKEQARTHYQRHGLTEALGVTDEVDEDVAVWPWDRDSCLLLCSDGLTDMIEDEDILRIVRASNGPQETCANLVTAANQSGGEDNISVILVCQK